MDALILRLRGPLMAFGDVAVDEIRPTDLLPGLSEMTGLIANALGGLFTMSKNSSAFRSVCVLPRAKIGQAFLCGTTRRRV